MTTLSNYNLYSYRNHLSSKGMLSRSNPAAYNCAEQIRPICNLNPCISCIYFYFSISVPKIPFWKIFQKCFWLSLLLWFFMHLVYENFELLQNSCLKYCKWGYMHALHKRSVKSAYVPMYSSYFHWKQRSLQNSL